MIEQNSAVPLIGFYNTDLDYTGLQIYGGLGSLSHDFKIWPIMGPVDPSFLVVKKISLTLIKKNHLTARLQKVHVGCQYSKTCLKRPLKKRQNKDLNNKW